MNINILVGKTLKSVQNVDDDELIFTTIENEVYKFYHSQNCCESVTIEDICGDLNDLVGAPILHAEEAISDNENPEGVEPPENQDCFTWTFYKFDTIKGSVTVRWYGKSNGCYSERVNFKEVD